MALEQPLRDELVRVCRELQRRGLIAATDGNVSCRLPSGEFLITPSGVSKGDLQAADVLRIDADGRTLGGSGNASSEVRVHLTVYARRPDVHAVVHAHPPMLTAFTLAGVAFRADVLPEVWAAIGPVPTVPYATPSTAELARAIEPFIAGHEALLLERHGSLTLGRSLREAYQRLDKLEHACRVLFYAQLLRGDAPTPLSTAQLEMLAALRRT
jgi:L-fuculose-phosphate aldolase